MPRIDLHIHTVFSDGTYTPEQAVLQAKKLGLVAISITDHDSVAGLGSALAAGKRLGIEVVAGVELSTDVGEDEIHILGYFLDWKKEDFLRQLDRFQAARANRNQKLLNKLDDLGMRVDHREVRKIAPQGVISRLHIARLMVEKGYVGSIGDAFEQWLSPGKPAYVQKMKIPPFDIIQLLLKAEAIPVLAHPFLSHRDDLIADLTKAGLKGIEVYHSSHNPRMVAHYQRIAQKHRLLITGGSDCHGEAKDKVLMGRVKVPENLLIDLKKAKEKMRCSTLT